MNVNERARRTHQNNSSSGSPQSQILGQPCPLHGTIGIGSGYSRPGHPSHPANNILPRWISIEGPYTVTLHEAGVVRRVAIYRPTPERFGGRQSLAGPVPHLQLAGSSFVTYSNLTTSTHTSELQESFFENEESRLVTSH